MSIQRKYELTRSAEFVIPTSYTNIERADGFLLVSELSLEICRCAILAPLRKLVFMRIRAGQNPYFPQCCILAMGLNLRLSSLRPNISQPYLLCVRTASADREDTKCGCSYDHVSPRIFPLHIPLVSPFPGQSSDVRCIMSRTETR